MSLSRRDVLHYAFAAGIARFEIPLALTISPKRSLRLAVITDLHHGLAPDAMDRLTAFVAAVKQRNEVNLLLQLGDFCYSDSSSKPCLDLFRELKIPKIQVLGNHDMDKVDKDTAMQTWGMTSRYGRREMGDFTFLWLNLNHFKKGGELHAYDKGNYFTDNATHNWADTEQLEWLDSTLAKTTKPVILLSHQPLGFAEPGQSLPSEQKEIVDIVSTRATSNPKGAVALSMFGHLHVDRLEHVGSIPFYCVNSASYFWSGGMWPYAKPLFAFMELTTDGRLVVEGVMSEFTKTPPKASDTVVGRSASISNRNIHIGKNLATL